MFYWWGMKGKMEIWKNGKSETLNHREQKEEDGFLPQIYADSRRF